jgi:predicted N-acetyltransferase YhbS
MLPSEPIPNAIDRAFEMPDVSTRAPRQEDLQAVVSIDASWRGSSRRDYLSDRLSRALSPPGIGISRIVERNGDVIGYLFGEVTRGEFGHSGLVAWIDTLGVRKDHARRGIATLLLQDFVHHAQAAGASQVRTLLDPADEALTDFLQAQRFTVAPTIVVERAL